jgi:hypothetical protein
MAAFGVPPQSVNATHALNRSAGVSNSNVLRGLSFSCRATLLTDAADLLEGFKDAVFDLRCYTNLHK